MEKIMENPSTSETENDSEPKMEILENIIDKSYKEIEKIAQIVSEKTGIMLDAEDIAISEIENKIIGNEEIIKILEVGSLIDKRIMLVSLFLIPILEKKTEIEERKDDIKNEVFERGIEASIDRDQETDTDTNNGKDNNILKEAILKQIENHDVDIKSMDKIADLLAVYSETTKGKKKAVVKIFSAVLKNEHVQKFISDEFRKILKEKKDAGQSDKVIATEIVNEMQL